MWKINDDDVLFKADDWVYSEDSPDYWLINEAWLRIYHINLLTTEVSTEMFYYYTSILSNDNLDNPKTQFGYMQAIKRYKGEYRKTLPDFHKYIINKQRKLKIKDNKENNHDEVIDRDLSIMKTMTKK